MPAVHPRINEQRAQAGWRDQFVLVSGTGALPLSAKAKRRRLEVRQACASALRGGLARLGRGLAAARRDRMRRLAAAPRAGQDVTLTLCGERRAQSWNRRRAPVCCAASAACSPANGPWRIGIAVKINTATSRRARAGPWSKRRHRLLPACSAAPRLRGRARRRPGPPAAAPA